MFAKNGQVDISDFPIIPQVFEMFTTLFMSFTWWQPILGGRSCNYGL